MKASILVISILSLSAICFAQKKSEPIYMTKEGAIGGYDPVSYFIESQPIKGEGSITYNWKNAVWHFSSEKNRKLFAENPEKYAPQYGGWCAYGWAKGYPAKTDPQAWRVVANKLYLNYNQNVQKDWDKKQDQYIQEANTHYNKQYGQ